MTKKERDHLYYITHKEQHREASKRWWANNKKKAAESNRKWESKNPEAHRAIVKRCFRKTVGNYLSSEFSWSEVEGFDNWTVNTVVHHRLEMFGFSMDELKAQDRYYNCTPDELVCMSHSEHNSLHNYLRAIAKKNP